MTVDAEILQVKNHEVPIVAIIPGLMNRSLLRKHPLRRIFIYTKKAKFPRNIHPNYEIHVYLFIHLCTLYP